jgi:hypothetical protein
VATAHGAGFEDAAAGLVGVRRRRQLDGVPVAVEFDDQCDVVEVAALPMLAGGLEGVAGSETKPWCRIWIVMRSS